jgi:hypothetical protein
MAKTWKLIRNDNGNDFEITLKKMKGSSKIGIDIKKTEKPALMPRSIYVLGKSFWGLNQLSLHSPICIE